MKFPGLVLNSRAFFVGLLLLLPRLVSAATDESSWEPASWNGEKALVSTTQGWKAIVSLERGRLISFGPADRDTNLLFAPPRRDDPAGWGGHRVWLGPQSTWAKIWPPPDAWEHSAAESFLIVEGTLRLVLPDAGDGWPRLTRTYRWQGTQLICGVELQGGTQNGQVIQILQVPQASLVEVTPKPDAVAALGYVLLPGGKIKKLTKSFQPPPHVSPRAGGLTLRHVGVIQKLGFRLQPLTARETDFTLSVTAREQTGHVVSTPDLGFSTQVYLGGTEPFIELEQLSPVFSADRPAMVVVVLEGAGIR